MTAEEAIKRIENHMEVHKIWKYPHIHLKEAFDMAITALRAQTDFNDTYINIAWLKQVEAERDALKEELDSIVHCRDCKYLYFKDFEAYCPHTVGPCKPSGFCDCGERSEGSNQKKA